MQMKKAKECGLDGKSGAKEGDGDNKEQASEGEHCPTSLASPAGDQVQASLSSPTPPKEGEHVHIPITSSSYCIRNTCKHWRKNEYLYAYSSYKEPVMLFGKKTL